MGLSDELLQLEQLRQRGVLSDEEFSRAKARLLADGPAASPGAVIGQGLRRSNRDRWIAGVCGGLVPLTGVEAWIWRLAFALMFFVAGTGVLLYILLWVFVPVASPAEESTVRLPRP
jgi:phage shock protein C